MRELRRYSRFYASVTCISGIGTAVAQVHTGYHTAAKRTRHAELKNGNEDFRIFASAHPRSEGLLARRFCSDNQANAETAISKTHMHPQMYAVAGL